MSDQLVRIHEKLMKKGDATYGFILVSHDFNEESHGKYIEHYGTKFPALKYGAKDEPAVDEMVVATKLDSMPYVFKLNRAGEIVSRDQAEIFKELTEKAE